MKIQQHDGVVVDAGRHSSRASPRLRGRDVTGGVGGARGWCMKSLLSPTIYRAKGEGGGAASALPPRKGAAREESLLPKAPRRCLPPLGLFPPQVSLRMGLLGLVPLAHIGQGAHPYNPCGPPGQVDPFGGPPDPFRHSRYNTDKVRNFSASKIRLPIYKSLPPDHSGTPRDVQDLIWDSEQLSGYRILISL